MDTQKVVFLNKALGLRLAGLLYIPAGSFVFPSRRCRDRPHALGEGAGAVGVC